MKHRLNEHSSYVREVRYADFSGAKIDNVAGVKKVNFRDALQDVYP
jgi:hypothetical protein